MKLNTKSIIAMTALCIQMFATDANAQVIIAMPDTTRFIYYSHPDWGSREYWSNGPVSLHRFYGGKTEHDSITAVVRYAIYDNVKYEKIGGTHYLYDNYEGVINYDSCQLNPKYKDDEHVRKYVQTIINIAEKYARIKTADYAPNYIWGYQDHDDYETRAQEAIERLSSSTNYGRDTAEVNNYYEKSVSELNDIPNPVEYASIFQEDDGWDAHCGLSRNFPQLNNIGNSYGISVGLGYYFNPKILLSTEFQVYPFISIKEDWTIGKRSAKKGYWVTNAKALMTLSAAALKTRNLTISPALHLGYEGYSITEPHDNNNNKDNDYDCIGISSFSFGAGMFIDIPLWRLTKLNDNKRNCYRGIRITPSVSLSCFNKGIGCITTYNLTVSYYGISRWLIHK